MKRFRLPIICLLFNTAQWALRPFPRLRSTLVKGLILMEENQSINQDIHLSLRRLLDVHGFIEAAIDKQCVIWGDGVHVKHQIMNGIHSFFTDRVPHGSRVLDVGCGIGALAYALAVHSQAEVIGMDTNKAHVLFATERFQHALLHFVVGDATVDLPGEKIDVVVLSSVLEHIVDRPDFLKKLVDRYRPSSILIRVPSFERHYHAALKRKLGLFAFTDKDHKIEYTTESFMAEMQNGYLEIVHMEMRWGDIWAECKPNK